MLDDIVVDTNVFLHAQNPKEQRSLESRRFLKTLLVNTTMLCVDQGFACNSSGNCSHIGTEYLCHLRAGSLGLSVIVALSGRGRIRQLKRRALQQTARRINQLLRDKIDRVFLSVAFNSNERILVSHDYKDFNVNKRRHIKKILSVKVIDARDGNSQLH